MQAHAQSVIFCGQDKAQEAKSRNKHTCLQTLTILDFQHETFINNSHMNLVLLRAVRCCYHSLPFRWKQLPLFIYAFDFIDSAMAPGKSMLKKRKDWVICEYCPFIHAESNIIKNIT